eukprot:TRINITY_DN6127_c0_g1_i1.p1 TRINITY_DN6127_c0_g1~~TRINITY_DN6127_c0_g1_i1.p1  ORF type:complete len:405 (+),score=66.24 TRINITY_DN6127_c0_g1_i1:223-1437(+)
MAEIFDTSAPVAEFEPAQPALKKVCIDANLKPFKCELCPKAYKRKSELKIHTRSHTGEKPFKCSQCDKAFPKRSHLTRHERTHAGIKPYKCGICQKRHARASDLKVHLRTHSGERPYACAICNKTFRTSSHCRMHERTHDETRCIPCTLCDKTFKTKPGLKQHMASAHEGCEPAFKPDSSAAMPLTTQPLITADGSNCLSVDAIAKACPGALQALIKAGLIKPGSPSATSATDASTSDSEDDYSTLLASLLPTLNSSGSLPELPLSAIPELDAGTTNAPSVQPVLNTLTACNMAYGREQTHAMWQQNARKFSQTTAQPHPPILTSNSVDLPPSPPSISATVAPQATMEPVLTLDSPMAAEMPAQQSSIAIPLVDGQLDTQAEQQGNGAKIDLLLQAATASKPST